MPEDRRSHKRVKFYVPVRWDGIAGTHEARLEDISLGGCFVNSRARVEINEVITLEIGLPSGEWLPLRGEVISYQPGIGFGLVFSFHTEEEKNSLKRLIP